MDIIRTTEQITSSTNDVNRERARRFVVTAIVDGDDRIACVEAVRLTPTREAGERIAAAFPKFVRVKASTLSGVDRELGAIVGVDVPAGHYGQCGYVSFRVDLKADDVNKGKNEAGLKRLRALVATVECAYYENAYANSATYEQFAALLA